MPLTNEINPGDLEPFLGDHSAYGEPSLVTENEGGFTRLQNMLDVDYDPSALLQNDALMMGPSRKWTRGKQWAVIPKLVSELRSSSASLLDDSILQFPTPSTGMYIVRVVALIDTANATMDYKYGTSFTGTASVPWYFRRHTAAGAASGTDNEDNLAGSGGQIASTAVTAASTFGVARVEIEMCIVVTVTGLWSFQWAQNTSNGGMIQCLVGSTLEWMKIA